MEGRGKAHFRPSFRSSSREEKSPKGIYFAVKELSARSSPFEASHAAFASAFPDGFPWEVLRVLSPPPKLLFTWR